jgi:hypothetical protein
MAAAQDAEPPPPQPPPAQQPPPAPVPVPRAPGNDWHSPVLSETPIENLLRPHKGSVELRLSPPLIAGIGQGIGYYNLSCDNCSNSNGIVTFSVLGGAGYLLSDLVELGGLLDVLFGSLSSGNDSISGFGFGIGPFVRFWVWLAPRAAMVPEISALFRMFNGSDNNGGGTTYTGVQAIAQLPFEFFLSHMWSLRIGPGYQFMRLSPDRGTSSLTLHSFVVNWAIAVYF